MAEKKICCSDSPFHVVIKEGVQLAKNLQLLAISAFQPRSRYSQSGPHQWLSKAIYVHWGPPLMGNLRLAEFCQVFLTVWWLHLPNLVSSFSFHNKPFAFVTPSQFTLPWELNLWYCISWSLSHHYYMPLKKEKLCELNDGSLQIDREELYFRNAKKNVPCKIGKMWWWIIFYFNSRF